MAVKNPPPVEVDHHAKLTPISLEPITPIDRTQWNKDGVQSLNNQLEALKNRYQILLRMGKHDVAQQLVRGIQQLESLIEQKQGTENG